MGDGLKFVIYDKTSAFRRDLTGLHSSADLLVNGISTAQFVLDDDHFAVADVVAEGARCGVWFRGAERFRGRISSIAGEGPKGTITATVEDDMRRLWTTQGWPVPSAPLNAQTSEYRVYTGPSETVFKTAVSENAVARLGRPWVLATSAGRGSAARAELRFHPLGDKLVPLLDADGLIIMMTHDEDSDVVTIDVRAGVVRPGVLTPQSGVIDSYKYRMTAATGTRITVGGRGEGVDRELVRVIDTARESATGEVDEIWADARNTEAGTDLTVDGAESLAEAAARVGISAELVETDKFRLWSTHDPGDFVHVRIGAVDSVEQIRGVSITDSPSDGVVVTPHIGEVDASADDDIELARSVARLARGFRDAGRR